ncbi:MAG: hypothetical protein LBR15_07275 [Methanobrevibacter sp.]|jgi:hypothetical protein|nr:hypothetical protein [Candidatus Methanovirga australis]
MRKYIGLFIILILAISPMASAANRTFTIPTNTHNSNINDGSAGSVYGNESKPLHNSSDIDTSLSFKDIMEYFSSGKKSSYVIIVGDLNNIQSCRFVLSEASPDGYHDVKNNFKYDLHDEIYKPTIMYDPEDFVWPTIFLTNSVSNPNVDQQAIFTLMVRNSQYASLNDMSIPDIDTNGWNVTFDDDADIGDVYDLLTKCYSIINMVKMKFDIQTTSYKRQSQESYVHNLIIGKKRGTDTSKYGRGYWPQFMGVSNDELEVMNIKYQTIKHYVKPTSFAIETAVLHLVDIQLVMKAAALAAGDIPVVGGNLKNALDYSLYAMDCLKQNIAWKKNSLDAEYNKADQMTCDISAEKSYRSEVDKSVMNPTTPTDSQLQSYNNNIDGYKVNLLNLSSNEYDRIFGFDNLEELRSKYMEGCKYYDDVIETYNMYGKRAPGKYYDYQKKYRGFYSDIDNVEKMNKDEQKVWDFYNSILDNQYNVLESVKFKR